MFGKKKKKTDVPAAETAAPQVKVKKKGGMSQIFHESVFESVLEILRNNEQFVIMSDGKPLYVAMALDVANIGGLDKKAKKDEAKGTIIECVNSGRFKTYITNDCLEENILVIIPEAATLAAMNEFSILTTAQYEFCTIDEAGDITLMGIPTTYDAVTNMVTADGHVSQLLHSEEDEDDEYEDEDAVLDDEDAPDSEDDSVVEDDAEDEEIPDMDPASDDDIEADDEDLEEDAPPEFSEGPIPVDETVAGMDDGAGMNPYEAAMAEEPAQMEPEDVIPGTMTEEAVARRFYSSNLGLEVTTDPFDAQFMQQNPFIPFVTDRPEGWLNNQLNEMSRDANIQMQRMHEANLFHMRERYFRLMAMQCDRIQQELDINDEGTQYGALYQSMQQEHNAQLANMEALVAKRKDVLNNNWKETLRQVGMAAAREAQNQYRERYQRQYEDQMYAIEHGVKASIDAEYTDDRKELQRRREEEAAAMLDLAITEVLDEISDMYMGCLKEEQACYEQLQQNMREFVDNNRKADIARSQALSDELRNSTEIQKLMAEQEQKIKTLQEEYSAKKSDLTAELERMRKETDSRIQTYQADADRQVQRVEAEKEELKKQYNQLLERYQNLDKDKDAQYAQRLAEKDDEISAWKSRNDHTEAAHKRNWVVAIFIMAIITVAVGAIGVIGGTMIKTSRQTDALVSEYQDALDRQNANDAQSEVPAVEE